MAIPVHFSFYSGLTRKIFSRPRLVGSWDPNGNFSNNWTELLMENTRSHDGCQKFTATVQLNATDEGIEFHWGVRVDTAQEHDVWAIMDELQDIHSSARYRKFLLRTGDPKREESYYFTNCRRLGAQKYFYDGVAKEGIRFSVWAPNANNAEVVFGEFKKGDKTKQTGYITDDHIGIDTGFLNKGVLKMKKTDTDPWDGVWETIQTDPALKNFSDDQHITDFDHRPYMFRITMQNERVAYRSDIYSRCQIGKGKFDPGGKHINWVDKQGNEIERHYTNLDGTKSCSVVINPDTVTKHFEEKVWPEIMFIPSEEFWANEYNPAKPVPKKIEDLVIYELHVGSLGYSESGSIGNLKPGSFKDVIKPEFIKYLTDLGINAIELLPVMEYEGNEQWGYGTSHYFAMEYSAGGRDQLKHLVREYHRNGIAVILDVVYNHYHHNSERAEWHYDSREEQNNIYYWYEGNPADYSSPHGGYVNNNSTGYAPRYYEEMVRKLFISSAATLTEEFHIDGLRLDLTNAFHWENRLNEGGATVSSANIFGAKFLRQFCRTLKLINPKVLLIAEDHSDWDKLVAAPDEGGIGFDATWYAAFYHHLVGDAKRGIQDARLLKVAGLGENGPLAIDYFAGALAWADKKRIVYSESHDEAGNHSPFDCDNTHRNIVVASNGAPLIGDTRLYAEARCRFALGMTILSAGIPMFFMGEEIGATKDVRYIDIINSREDLLNERHNHGAALYNFYADLIKFRLNNKGIRYYPVEVIYKHNDNRILAFRRYNDKEEFLIVASLNNEPFPHSYAIHHPALTKKSWKEVFNSDATRYGGKNIGNGGSTISPANEMLNVILPANGFVVFQSVN
jgi:1,4-alpha-glucan branching enzyme